MAGRSLRNEQDRATTIERIRRIRPDTRPAWGALDAPRMLCHLADQLRVALGDAPSKPVHTVVTRTLLKFVVVNTGFKPPRGKVQTAPEMLATRPATWESDVAACIALVERVATESPSAVHPMFGPLSPEEWGRLCWKHIDHHLVQFGV